MSVTLPDRRHRGRAPGDPRPDGRAAGHPLLVMDLGRCGFSLDVYERDLAQVRVGQSVRVKVAAYPGKEFRAWSRTSAPSSIRRRARSRSASSSRIPASSSPACSRRQHRRDPGEKHEHLFVPARGVQRDGDKTIVFVPRGDSAVPSQDREARSPGGRLGGDPGGTGRRRPVVTSGSFVLKSELKKGELGEGE